jgi:acyl-CoA dehydrogenase
MPRTVGGLRIGEFQLIQLKLARMEVARLNIENLVLRQIEMASAGRPTSLAEASAGKLYSAEAVQLFGGNGYMAEQVSQITRSLLGAS